MRTQPHSTSFNLNLIHNHNKSEVWQLVQLISSAIRSLLSTNCHPMSGKKLKKKEKNKNWSSSRNTPNLQQGNLKSVAADFAGHKKSYSSFRNCFLTSAALLGHRVAVSIRIPEQTSVSGNCFFCSDFNPPTFTNQHSDKWKSLLKAMIKFSCLTSTQNWADTLQQSGTMPEIVRTHIWSGWKVITNIQKVVI